MKYNLLSACFAIMLAQAANGAELAHALIVHLSADQQVALQLEDQPVISFQDDQLVITTHMNEFRYLSADVKKFTYAYIDIESIGALNMPQSLVSLQGDLLTIEGLTPGSDVTVYASDGKLVASIFASHSGTASILLPAQSGLAYAVKTSFMNFKIVKP